ncbi:leucyl aminopeptidase [Thermomonospora cellulosilytica]|uniref:Probable cytosol aminopeptidase n=1 Tax=Thermomonospora cellulosilytica TaxID=1411118 RepID=A0A7W3MXW0_9ACTN|nr:leucyl aminopeptidase [Thermomonospora cellulosilytica]MBA9003861.1 leucyl aminopeptidase [Thermomonospora cellulosilytica]
MPIRTRISPAGDGRPAGEIALAEGAELVAVPVRPGPEADVAGLGVSPPVDPAELLAFHDAKGEAGEVLACPLRLGDRTAELLLYGVGDGSPGALRRAGAALARRAKGREHLVAVPPEGDPAAFAEGLLLGSYEFWIGEEPRKRAVGAVTVRTADRAAVDRAVIVAQAVAQARDLANQPSTDKGPAWLADRAVEFAEAAGLGVRIRDENALRAEGFGGLLTVGAGSPRPPRLIELTYEPEGGADRHVVLVGKGITFDSGGLSLKPTDNMKTMKTDMAAGGAVMAVLRALPALNARVRVTGLVAAAENAFSGSAMRPSDVISHYGGKTSEVLNTDAEGRLVLADALAYADADLDPDEVIDVATLTGAAKVALGLRHGALFATDDALADRLLAAGEAAGEPLWRMPLVDDYRPGIDSEVADVANIERRGYGGGAIMAALFLREFAGKRPWAHLDIAGPARSTSDEAELTKGATGYGVRLLLTLLTTA